MAAAGNAPPELAAEGRNGGHFLDSQFICRPRGKRRHGARMAAMPRPSHRLLSFPGVLRVSAEDSATEFKESPREIAGFAHLLLPELREK